MMFRRWLRCFFGLHDFDVAINVEGTKLRVFCHACERVSYERSVRLYE